MYLFFFFISFHSQVFFLLFIFIYSLFFFLSAVDEKKNCLTYYMVDLFATFIKSKSNVSRLRFKYCLTIRNYSVLVSIMFGYERKSGRKMMIFQILIRTKSQFNFNFRVFLSIFTFHFAAQSTFVR